MSRKVSAKPACRNSPRCTCAQATGIERVGTLMSRWPKAPGGGPKSMRNPVYWTRRELQDQRYRKAPAKAARRYNERYRRLWEIYHHCWDNFYEPVQASLSGKEIAEFETLNGAFIFLDAELTEQNIQTQQSLDRMATKLKALVVFVLGACIEHRVFSDITQVRYDTQAKSVYVDFGEFYFLG